MYLSQKFLLAPAFTVYTSELLFVAIRCSIHIYIYFIILVYRFISFARKNYTNAPHNMMWLFLQVNVFCQKYEITCESWSALKITKSTLLYDYLLFLNGLNICNLHNPFSSQVGIGCMTWGNEPLGCRVGSVVAKRWHGQRYDYKLMDCCKSHDFSHDS